jgi:hypothetical protein
MDNADYSPPKKRAKKTKTVDQRFRPDYSVAYPVIKKSLKSSSHAFCSLCRSDFSVAHGGLNDVKKHVSTLSHISNAKQAAGCQNLIAAFGDQSMGEKVTNAELLFTNFLIEHNVPLASADHSGQLFKAMFPDSAIASKYACARSKSSAMVEV